MERWELKMICAAVALLVSVVCSFLPYLLIYVNCKKLTKKLQKKKKKPSGNPLDTSNNQDAELSSKTGSDENEVPDNSSVPLPEEILEERSEDQQPDQPVENEYSDLKIMGYLMCFGGGVFLGTFLLHMLPEVTQLLQNSLIKPYKINYNITELLVGVGFFVILFAEESFNACRKMKAKRSAKRKQSSADIQLSKREVDDSAIKSSQSWGSGEHSFDTGFENSNEAIDRQNGISASYHHEIGDDHKEHNHHHHHHHHHDHHHHHHDHHHHHHHTTRSIALVLALSLHHIFEGLSIGLQKYSNNVWHLTVAVLCHEAVICFSMGLQFYKEDRKLNKKVFSILLVAALVMPLGIVIGIVISETRQDRSIDDLHDWQNILNGVLQSLACGTFIYVTFFEILCDELTNGNSSPLKVIFVGLGFTFMALLGLIPESTDHLWDFQAPSNWTTLMTTYWTMT